MSFVLECVLTFRLCSCQRQEAGGRVCVAAHGTWVGSDRAAFFFFVQGRRERVLEHALLTVFVGQECKALSEAQIKDLCDKAREALIEESNVQPIVRVAPLCCALVC